MKTDSKEQQLCDQCYETGYRDGFTQAISMTSAEKRKSGIVAFFVGVAFAFVIAILLLGFMLSWFASGL